jgi:hypothetical protein
METPFSQTKTSGSRDTSVIRRLLVVAIAVAIPLLAPPTASATPSIAATPAKDCWDTAIPGELGLGINQRVNVGGPNFVSGVCEDINIRLTDARYTTWAMACLEPSRGGSLDCDGGWVRLVPNTWQRLRVDVYGGTRWQLHMKSSKADTVKFDYTA